jgi:hypothetical protein
LIKPETNLARRPLCSTAKSETNLARRPHVIGYYIAREIKNKNKLSWLDLNCYFLSS